MKTRTFTIFIIFILVAIVATWIFSYGNLKSRDDSKGPFDISSRNLKDVEVSSIELMRNPEKYGGSIIHIRGTLVSMVNGPLKCRYPHGDLRLYDNNDSFLLLIDQNKSCKIGDEGVGSAVVTGIVGWNENKFQPFIYVKECIIEGLANRTEWLTTVKDITLEGSIPDSEDGYPSSVNITYTTKRNTKYMIVNLLSSEKLDFHLFDETGRYTGYPSLPTDEGIPGTKVTKISDGVIIELSKDLSYCNFTFQITSYRRDKYGSGQYNVLVSEYPEIQAEIDTIPYTLSIKMGQSENAFVNVIECGGFHGLSNIQLIASDFLRTDGAKISSSSFVFHENGFNLEPRKQGMANFTLVLPKEVEKGEYKGIINISAIDSITGLSHPCCTMGHAYLTIDVY